MPRTDTASLLIPAPASALYQAFARPGAIERWMPPEGMGGEMLEFDFRPGGHFRLRLRYLDPGQAQGKTSADTDEALVRITGLVPDERIATAVTFESDDPRFAGVMKGTWSFTPAAGGTLVEVRAEDVPDGIRPEDHDAGLRSSLANLARFVGATGPAIEIVPYDPAWPARFREEQALLADVLDPWLAAPIEHVGSTAVPGLAAKPIIDILVPVASLDDARAAIEPLRRLGYQHYPYKPQEMHWFCKPSPSARTHHIHMVVHGGPAWADRLAFRDALRADPERAAGYAQLKLRLAAQHRADRDAYTEAKGAFVESTLERWRAGGA